MKNYIESNLEVINFYREMYKNKIDVSGVISIIESRQNFDIDLTQFQRFRIFLDSCLLLWNREKFEKKYFKDKFIYKYFFDDIKDNEAVQRNFDYINKLALENHFDECNGFYLPENKRLERGWDQLCIVRNGLAHMQYEAFIHAEDGPLFCFVLYNKDKGVMKSKGVVIEQVFHDFVKKFFSNYTNIGVPFKHTWFSGASSMHYSGIENVFFYEVTYKDTQRYTGDPIHKMNELTKNQKSFNDVMKFLNENESIFDVKKTKVSDIIDKELVSSLIEKSDLGNLTNDEYFLILKFILDPETEISNFLVHISQLNDRVCDYIMLSKNNMLTKDRENNLILSLNELYEDRYAHFAFQNSFNLLIIMNVIFRVQDEYYPEVNFRKLDMNSFKDLKIDSRQMIKKINENILKGKVPREEEKDAYKDYWMDKLRNSLMHGNISTDINKNGNLEFVFTDIFKGRNDEIRLESESLKEFSLQEIFYSNIPNDYGYLNNSWKKV